VTPLSSPRVPDSDALILAAAVGGTVARTHSRRSIHSRRSG